jgi:bifunctional DNA-binding transcriptional regulator/antitoxin component of YhaV-PrlF toxin-antitoxin module
MAVVRNDIWRATFRHHDCNDAPMMTLKVDARGRVTLGKKVLLHLGVEPGETVAVHLLPHGRVVLVAARQTGSIDAFIGLLADRASKVVSIEEIQDAVTYGWAGSD